ncbi:MAG: zinc ribbon domain-containing protein [Clostridiales bacterium]|nr:zinc ribbon domain-containing protein [Clostridiales bacterium]HOB37349.1 zinc ribbon domain-containing protein [Candidatus Avimonas sp.]HQD38834.1 zinc ribbon domain-containing protein [Candidatus Avimonas sp.]
MTKGKFGISTTAVAVIAFAFAALRQPMAVLLICGFALLAERDEWLNKQTLQSLLLTVTYYLTISVIGWVFGGLSRFFNWVEVYRASSAMNYVNSVAGDVIYIAFIALCVFAILRVLREKDAGLPVLSKMAGGDFTAAIKPKAPPAQYIQPQQTASDYTPHSAPAQTPPTEQVSSENAAPSAKFCSSCGATVSGDSAFCAECGAKIE